MNRIRSSKSRRKRALRSFLDIVAVCLILSLFGLVYILVPPYNQGFYCDDRTILKPYRNDTVPMWSVAIYSGILPVLIIIFIEIWRYYPLFPSSLRKQHRVDCLRDIFHTICLFGLGIATTFLLTEVGKRSYGRLRPHFLDVCKPDWSSIQCFDRVVLADGNTMLIPRYITDYQCHGTDNTKIKEARISFPSGHSSIACFSFSFLLVYFDRGIFCESIHFLKPVLQCICICVMFFTCLSRITDHKHHYSDVIGGAFIGSSVAFFITLRVANVFKPTPSLRNVSNESKHTQCECDLLNEAKLMQFIPTRNSNERVTRIPLHCIEDDYDNLGCYISS